MHRSLCCRTSRARQRLRLMEGLRQVSVTRMINEKKKADKLVLPGVGAFGDCKKNLDNNGLVPVILDEISNGKPLLGICLGMQCMVIEYARDVLGMAEANSTEMDPKTPYNVIDLMEEQKSITNMGGTMRLGGYECELKPGSKVAEIYQSEVIRERHRHRYEFNSDFRAAYENAGMKCVGTNPETNLVEIVEIPNHKWYIGTQFHPEYSSTVLKPHALFLSFVKACQK